MLPWGRTLAKETCDLIIIDLWSPLVDCHICNEPAHKKGIPIYEGLVLPDNWDGEWGGVPACDACFEKQQRLSGPVTFHQFKEME